MMDEIIYLAQCSLTQGYENAFSKGRKKKEKKLFIYIF